jgi:hypothetical protein
MMNNIDKILKALESVQTDVTALRSGQQTLEAGQKAVQADVQNQGKRLTALETGQIALDLKVEAIHAYQKQAHDEIMGHLIDSTEIAGRDQKILEKRIERIEKHLGLPPLK